MIKSWILSGILLLSFSAQAKKFEIPDDSKVLSQFGECHFNSVPAKLNLFVWNIHKAKDKDRWAQDLDYFAAKSDTVLLQEAILDSYMPEVALRQKGYCWNFATSFFNKDEAPTGIMSGSLTRPLKTVFFRSTGREPVIQTPKMTLVHEYAIANYAKTLLVANIHGLNFVPDRLNQEQVTQVVNYMKNHEGPIVFAGDFNSWNNDRLLFLEKAMASIGLKKVVFPTDNRRLKLDHIYARGLNLGQSTLHMDIESSDHKPLSAVFTIE